MSSIIRARSGLTRWSERLEGIAGSSLEPKVAGPSMLGIGCPDRHPLLRVTSPKTHPPRRAPLPRERVRSLLHPGTPEDHSPDREDRYSASLPCYPPLCPRVLGQTRARRRQCVSGEAKRTKND